MFPVTFLFQWIRSFHDFHVFLSVCTLQHLLNFISVIASAIVSFSRTYRLDNAVSSHLYIELHLEVFLYRVFHSNSFY